MGTRYPYVGPASIRERACGQRTGTPIAWVADVVAFAASMGQVLSRDGFLAATFVIDLGGRLLLADRHSEHVACAGGQDVLAAGEIFFTLDDAGRPVAGEVTNQSTGYCPEPDCFAAVAAALDRVGIVRPDRFTAAFAFRRCPACGQRNLVKDGFYACDVCGHELPRERNI